MFVGGVPNGSQDKNTKHTAIQSNGAKPERNASKNLTIIGTSLWLLTTLGPNFCNLSKAVAKLKPLVMLIKILLKI